MMDSQKAIDILTHMMTTVEQKRAVDYVVDKLERENKDPRTDEELGSAYAYCEDCRLVEVCRYYPYEGCDFKEVGWISPKKKLPNEDDRVLTTIKINKREPKVRSGRYHNGCFYNDNGDCWTETDKEVIAWMPQPKPYGKEDWQMQIVIDIPDETYQEIIDGFQFDDATVRKTIQNGTVLPKGHGRLISADGLINDFGIADAERLGDNAESYNQWLGYDIKNFIDNAPTVLEADKEE